MNRSRPSIALLAVALLLPGCTASPWSASRSGAPAAATTSPAAANPTAPPPAAAAAPQPVAPGSAAPSAPGNAAIDPQALQQVLADVQRVGALDQASQDRLMHDLQQTDPALWPLVVQQFRAALAYRQQAEQRRLAASATGQPGPSGQVNGLPNPDSGFASAPLVADRPTVQPNASPPYQPAQGTIASNPRPQPGSVCPERAAPPPAQQAPTPQPAQAQAASGSPAAQPLAANDQAKTVTAQEPSRPDATQSAAQPAKPPAGAGEVNKASYNAEALNDWRAHIAAAARARESEIASGEKRPDEDLRQAQLRLLYLLSGRRDDAMRPIAASSPAVQSFWAEELFGLAALMDAERVPDPSRRAAEAKQHLGEAVTKLSDACPLLVRNLTFCTKIQSYGCIKQFDKYEFSPGQNLLLYAEVENLTGESTPQGIHTSLRSSYQIFDSRNQRVADDEFTLTEEYCRNPRRDYFIGYEFHLPERIYPGKHTLQLTIEDLKSHKVGQASIELAIKKPGR